jgi:hypothetical protein
MLQLPFEGGTGNAYNDYSGNNYPVSIPSVAGNDPEFQALSGYNGFGSVNFDGNDYLSAGKIFPTGSSYTKVAWVYHSSNGTYDNIISGGRNGAFNHTLKVNPDGHINAGHYGGSYIVYDPLALDLNTWTHVAVTFNLTTKRMILYRNGVQVDNRPVADSLLNVTDSTVLVGALAGLFGWHGNIDQASLYNKVLTPAQIAALYQTQNKIVPNETTSGDKWHAVVIPFTSANAGNTYTSNSIYIDIPTLDNVFLASTSGNNLDADSLKCTYNIIPSATTAVTAWYRNGSPLARLHLPFEGGNNFAFRDYSGNGNNATIPSLPGNDPAFFSTGGHNGRGAIHFDGNDYLSAGNIFPTGSSYTKTAWIYNSGNGTIEHNIISGVNAVNNHTFKVSTTGNLNAGHYRGTNYVSDPVSLNLNTWYFVAVTFNISNGLMILYKNGVEVNRATVPAAYRNVTDATVYIGALDNYYMWNGYIDDARIYNYALTPQQINAMFKSSDVIVPEETQPGDKWQARVTPFSPSNTGSIYNTSELLIEVPNISGVSIFSHSGNNLDTDTIKCTYTLIPSAVTAATAWYRNNTPLANLYLPVEGGTLNMLTDYSGNNRTVTIPATPGNDPVFLPTSGHDGRGALNLDGSDFLNAGKIFPVGGSYTKTAWVYRTATGTYFDNIISGYTNAANNHCFKVNPDGTLNAGHNGGSPAVADPTVLSINTWYFVAVSFNVANGEMILYKNGVEVNRNTLAPIYRNVTDSGVFIGAMDSSFAWHGNIDDARLYNFVLTPQQIAAMYQSSNVIVPTETQINDIWQAHVTPFSVSRVGSTVASNALLVDVPQLSNVTIFSSSGNNFDADSLKCTYSLIPSANTVATAWYRNNTPYANLLMPFEGGNTYAFRDYSGNNRAITIPATAGNDPVFQPSTGHDGRGSMNFDGNDFLDAGNIFPIGGSYTKTAWIYRTANGNYDNIISGYTNAANNHSFKVHNTNLLTAGHNGGAIMVTDNTPIALNTWYFVAVSFNVSNGEMVLYKNGIEVNRNTVAIAYRNVTDAGVFVGAMDSLYAWHGNIDDARLYNTVLTPQQINAIYQSSDLIVPQETFSSDRWYARVTPFSPSNAGTTYQSNDVYIDVPQISGLNLFTSPGINQYTDSLKYTYNLISGATTAAKNWILNGKPAQILYLPFEGGAIDALNDYSGNNNNVQAGSTLDNDPLFQPNIGRDGRGAISFDGNDFLNAGKIFPTHSSYTISAWVYRTSENAYDNIVSSETEAPNNHYLKVNADNHLNAGHNGAAAMVYDPNPLSINTWYHVALTFDFYTGEMKLFKNGVVVDRDTLAYPFRIITDSTVQIGALANDYEWNGYIDDIIITDQALPEQQIYSLYTSVNPYIVPPVVAAGDSWQVNVTPFSATNAGFNSLSNIVHIQSPIVSNVSLQSRTNNFFQKDSLRCSFELGNGATTAGIAWYKNGQPNALLYMPFEGDTLSKFDLSGNSNTISIDSLHRPRYFSYAGFDGKGAMYFDGNDFLDAGDIFPTGSSYTKTAWIYRTAENTWHNILSGDRNYLNNHSFKVGNDNRLNAGHNGGGFTVRDTAEMQMYQWYFVAVTYNYNTGEMILYKNGTEVDRDTVDIAYRNVTDDGVLIGSVDSSYNWQGFLDDVRLYDYNLSSNQIKAMYAAQNVIVSDELKLGDTWEARITPFSIRNGGTTLNTQSVIIHGMEVTDIPDQAINQGQTFNTVSLNDYVTDVPYNDTLITWSVISNELIVNINNNTRVATITTPYPSWFGSEEIMFIAQDPDYAIDTIRTQFTVTPINHNPVISGLNNQTINEGEAFAVINLDDYVTDAINSDSEITWQVLGQDALTINISPLRVATVVVPGPEWSGADTVKFVTSDPSNFRDTATVIFTVLSVNDAPVLSGIPNQTIDEGGSFTDITLNTFVSDVDNSLSELTWNFTGNEELTILVNQQTSLLQISAPDENWFGSENIAIIVSDLDGASDTVYVTFKVNAVNDKPVLAQIPNQSIMMGETFQTITLDLYVTDLDNTNDELTWTFSGNTDLILIFDPVTRVVTVTAPQVWVGSEEITFRVSDPGLLTDEVKATFTVNIGTSTKEPVSDKLNVYPVPADNFVNVEVPGNGKILCYLYNSMGVLMKNGAIISTDGSKFNINSSKLPNGDYIIKVIVNNRIYVQKIIVVHK